MSAKRAKKIAVQKHDEPSFVIEQLLDTENDSLIFSIPKSAKFSNSVSNFRLLKKQAELLGKDVRIESVDDEALDLALEAGLEGSNPFFGRMRSTPMNDIVAPRRATRRKVVEEEGEEESDEFEDMEEFEDPSSDVVSDGEPVMLHRHKQEVEEVEEEGDEMDDLPVTGTDGFVGRLGSAMRSDKGFKKYHDDEEAEYEEKLHRVQRYTKHPRRSAKRIFTYIVLALIIFGLLPYLALAVLPKAEITLTTKKTDFEFSGEIIANTAMGSVSASERSIPGQVFSEKFTDTYEYKASGEEYIERKARGVLTIYNAYSADSQSLVATTRFQTPDGMVYRLVENVVVPGAKIEAGKIAAASVEVDVVADVAGEELNTGPVKKLTVPGFKGSDKYEGFYGELKDGATGGFKGNSKVATKADIEEGLAKARTAMKDGADFSVSSKIPDGFLVLEDAEEFAITKEFVDDRAGENGNFRITLEAELRQFAFSEDDLNELLSSFAFAEMEVGPDYQIDNSTVSYDSLTADFENGELILDIDYVAQVEQAIDVVSLKRRLSGVKRDSLERVLSSVSGLDGEADIDLWPFWVRRVPSNESKIELTVD
ncbi:MAG: hypothetical protein R3B52_02855 [Candidatus Paceibacterota bacterium]